MTKTQKPYGVGTITKHGLCITKEYQTIGAAIDGLIRLQPHNEQKLQVFKHVQGDQWQHTDFLNHALNKLESVVKP